MCWQGYAGTHQGMVNPPRCECHECTQARYKTSLQGQMAIAMQNRQLLSELATPKPKDGE